ncbi:MAG: hypothetical protein QM766_27910 [Burkholderiaceae bacterium]
MSVRPSSAIAIGADPMPSGRRVLVEMLHGALYLLASFVLLRVLHSFDRAPFSGPEDSLSLLFLFGAMAMLRLMAWHIGLRGWQGVVLPMLFVSALPFTFLQRTDRHDFGEWFALLLIAYLALTGSRWLMALTVCLSAMATPMAVWMPLVCAPMLLERDGWRATLAFVAVTSAAAWTAGILSDGHAVGQSLMADLDHLLAAWRKGWNKLANWQEGDLRHLRKLVPIGTNLLNMLVLALLLERFVFAAPRRYLASLGLALGCCLFLSVLNRQLPSHLLALVIPPLFICMVEGVRRVPPLLHKPPVPILVDEQPMQRG